MDMNPMCFVGIPDAQSTQDYNPGPLFIMEAACCASHLQYSKPCVTPPHRFCADVRLPSPRWHSGVAWFDRTTTLFSDDGSHHVYFLGTHAVRSRLRVMQVHIGSQHMVCRYPSNSLDRSVHRQLRYVKQRCTMWFLHCTFRRQAMATSSSALSSRRRNTLSRPR
jgi:hypothetical protein